MRARLLAMAIAVAGVLILRVLGKMSVETSTFAVGFLLTSVTIVAGSTATTNTSFGA